MGIVDDILKALDRIPIWSRLQQLPTEVDDLKARIITLEEKLGGKWPGDVCRLCGERAARISFSNVSDKGIINEGWDCSKCGERDFRHYKVGPKG
jgi:hypothetical protein